MQIDTIFVWSQIFLEMILEVHEAVIPSFDQIFIDLFLFAPIRYSTSQLKKHNETTRQYDNMFFDLLQSTKSSYIKHLSLFEYQKFVLCIEWRKLFENCSFEIKQHLSTGSFYQLLQ